MSYRLLMDNVFDMGIFDFFKNKKKENARQELLRLQQKEKRRVEEQRRLAEQRKRMEQKESKETLKPYVDKAISTFEAGNISLLQNELFQFASLLNNPGSGVLITSFSQKDRLCEVFNLCLQFDWMNDSDIREVWAENAFYCIAEYFKTAQTKQDYIAAALDLFLTCSYGKNSLKSKIEDILYKAQMHPIHSNLFSQKEYNEGAEYLIREFAFFAATIVSPVVRVHPNIISPKLKLAYESAKTDFEFATIAPEDIIRKMSFISAIIGSILNDY